MGVPQFTATIQSNIYRTWLKQLNKNIVNNTVKELRSSQQTSEKTSFYIDSKKIQEMYKTVTGKSLERYEADILIKKLAESTPTKDKSKEVVGILSSTGETTSVFFKKIGFDTISTKLVPLFDAYPEVQEAYKHAEEEYARQERVALEATTSTSTRRSAWDTSSDIKVIDKETKRKLLAEIDEEAKRRATFGYYFNKGHVISLATNLAKQFRDNIAKADGLALQQRKLLIGVLDQYINNLQSEDLASANLPNAVNQELYASYIKSSDTYLVEIQSRVENQAAGNLSIAQVGELRKIFSITDAETQKILNSSPALGVALITTKGSPSFIDLLSKGIAQVIATGKKSNPKPIKQAPVLIAKKVTKIEKPKRNTVQINVAKKLRSKLQSIRSDPNKFKSKKVEGTYSTINLEAILRSRINEQVAQNMGTGSERRVLNYRTGRLAESVDIEKVTESRQGMISVFYSYMKNPYATFSEGGKQQYPKTRDPKLLISRSIRDIAGPLVSNRLRSVVV